MDGDGVTNVGPPNMVDVELHAGGAPDALDPELRCVQHLERLLR
jgi:hypothetical protein